MKTKYLTKRQKHNIKTKIYESSLPEQQLGYYVGMSQSNVHRVIKGTIWQDIAWPDGTTGRLKLTNRKMFNQGKERKEEQTQAFKEEYIAPVIQERKIKKAVEKSNKQIVVNGSVRRLALQEAIKLYPDFILLGPILKEGSSELIFVTEALLFIAHEKDQMNVFMDKQMLQSSIEGATTHFGWGNKLPEIKHFFDKYMK